MGLSATTIRMVVQLGLPIMRRGALNASSPLTSGTTSGTSSSMRKALELSIIRVPCLVMVSANSREVDAPAEVKAMSMLRKSSLCGVPLQHIPAPERVGASGASRGAEKGEVVNGKVCLVEHAQQFLTYGTLAPTIAMFIVCG